MNDELICFLLPTVYRRFKLENARAKRVTEIHMKLLTSQGLYNRSIYSITIQLIWMLRFPMSNIGRSDTLFTVFSYRKLNHVMTKVCPINAVCCWKQSSY